MSDTPETGAAFKIGLGDDGEPNYRILIGPNGWECYLGEPEDMLWGRDLECVWDKLNEQDSQNKQLERERDAAREELRDIKDAYNQARSDLTSDEVHCSCCPALKAQLAKANDQVSSSEFRAKMANCQHNELEDDYLAIWKLIKLPNESVVGAVKRLVSELTALRASQMDEERAREVLGDWTTHNDGLFWIGQSDAIVSWIHWHHEPHRKYPHEEIELGGGFSPTQLEAIAWWMRNKGESK